MACLIERRNRIKQAVPHIATASGSIASFNTDLRSPLEEIKIHFNPLQASGTPSPTNVLPITGWTGCDIFKGNKNFLTDTVVFSSADNSYFYYTLADNGIMMQVKKAGSCFILIKIIDEITKNMVGTQFVYSASTININDAFVSCKADGSSRSQIPNGTIRQEDVGKVLTLRWYAPVPNEYPTTYTVTNMQVELGSTASSFDLYERNKIPVSWSALGTVYGGWVNPISGEVWADCLNIASYNGETLPGEWKSDRDVYAPGTTPTTGAQVVYKLSTPVLVGTISPIALKTLVGANNIWSNANGNTDAKYWTH